jgi:hypothetical protein
VLQLTLRSLHAQAIAGSTHINKARIAFAAAERATATAEGRKPKPTGIFRIDVLGRFSGQLPLVGATDPASAGGSWEARLAQREQQHIGWQRAQHVFTVRLTTWIDNVSKDVSVADPRRAMLSSLRAPTVEELAGCDVQGLSLALVRQWRAEFKAAARKRAAQAEGSEQAEAQPAGGEEAGADAAGPRPTARQILRAKLRGAFSLPGRTGEAQPAQPGDTAME